MNDYQELRQKLSDEIVPFLFKAILNAQISEWEFDGNLYNPDGTLMMPSNT